MANLVRSPKSGSEWNQNELLAYKIKVKSCNEKEFFREKLGKIFDKVDQEFLNFEFAEGIDTPEENNLLGYLDLALRAVSGQESAVDDFSSRLLSHLGYEWKRRLIRTRYLLRFFVSGTDSWAQPDICLIKKK